MHVTRKEVAGAEHCGRFIGRGGEASSVREDPVGRFRRGLGEIHGVEIGRFRESNKPSTVPRDVLPGPRTRAPASTVPRACFPWMVEMWSGGNDELDTGGCGANRGHGERIQEDAAQTMPP